MLQITFKGRKYLFVGPSLKERGAIATKRAYQRGEESFAHYFPRAGGGGDVLRHGKVVGTRKDIKVVGRVKVTGPTGNEAFDRLLEATFFEDFKQRILTMTRKALRPLGKVRKPKTLLGTLKLGYRLLFEEGRFTTGAAARNNTNGDYVDPKSSKATTFCSAGMLERIGGKHRAAALGRLSESSISGVFSTNDAGKKSASAMWRKAIKAVERIK